MGLLKLRGFFYGSVNITVLIFGKEKMPHSPKLEQRE